MKILMFFHGGSLNRGCEAIVRSGVQIIKNAIPNAFIGVSSTCPKSDEIMSDLIDSIHDGTNSRLSKFSLTWWIGALRNKFLNDETYILSEIHKKVLNLIPQYDIFLSVGGDNYCYGEQPGIYEIDRQIKKAGKKLVLWGASIGEDDLSEEKLVDLKRFDLILARETLTKQVLENVGLTNVILCADGAFTMEKKELPLPDEWIENQMIGFNYSPLIFSKNPQSKEAAFALVKHILDTTPNHIAFTPHVIQPDNDDYECLLEFYEYFKPTHRVILLPNHLNATEYKGYISRMRFFIGARTHATIAAYSSGVPTMVLGYSIKSRGIARDIFGEEKLVLKLDEISKTSLLIEKFNELLKDEVPIKQVLAQKIPEIKNMSFLAGEKLKELK